MNARGFPYRGRQGGDPRSKVTILSSLTGLTSGFYAHPPLETVGYYRSSPRDFIGGACGSVSQRTKMPESGCDFVLEDIGDELLMPPYCPEFAGGKAEGPMLNAIVRNDEDFAGTASGRVDGRAPHLGVSTKRTGLCHPFRVVLSLLGYQGWLRATPGYSNGIPPGCARRETPE